MLRVTYIKTHKKCTQSFVMERRLSCRPPFRGKSRYRKKRSREASAGDKRNPSGSRLVGGIVIIPRCTSGGGGPLSILAGSDHSFRPPWDHGICNTAENNSSNDNKANNGKQDSGAASGAPCSPARNIGPKETGALLRARHKTPGRGK